MTTIVLAACATTMRERSPMIRRFDHAIVTCAYPVRDLVESGVLRFRINTDPHYCGMSGGLGALPAKRPPDSPEIVDLKCQVPIAEGWGDAVIQYDGRTAALVITHARIAQEQIRAGLDELRRYSK